MIIFGIIYIFYYSILKYMFMVTKMLMVDKILISFFAFSGVFPDKNINFNKLDKIYFEMVLLIFFITQMITHLLNSQK